MNGGGPYMTSILRCDVEATIAPHLKFNRQTIRSIVNTRSHCNQNVILSKRVGTLLVATIYLQLIQNRYMSRSFTVLHCSHQHCVQPVASDVEVVGYL